MANNILPIAQKTLRIKNWYAELINEIKEVVAISSDGSITISAFYQCNKNELWLTSPDGKVFIIRTSTFEFPNIPRYVKKRLDKHGFLNFWRTAQLQNALRRLYNARRLYYLFTNKMQYIPLKPEFSCIIPLILPTVLPQIED